MSSPVVLILGAGANIGAHLTQAFSAKGYRIALASRRTPAGITDGQLHVPVDLGIPENVPGVFNRVKEEFSTAPSVVIYNCASHTRDEKSDPLSSFSLVNFIPHQNLNTNSVLIALQQAVVGFRSLADTNASKTFIFTGNILNVVTVPYLLTFGINKSATAYAIRSLVEWKLYASEGISFYYADERTSTGQAVDQDISGAAAAEEYSKLADRKDQGPWLYTFTRGGGYMNFAGVEIKLHSARS